MRKHGPGLVTMLWRILGSEQDACDAYQETFLQLAHCRNGQEPRNVKAYLFRSASNVAISMLRRRKTYERTTRGYAEQVLQQSGGREFDAAGLQEDLRRHLARLPEPLRDVVLLRDLGEMPYGQVAKIMGITPGTARVYRHRAIQLLAAWMGRE